MFKTYEPINTVKVKVKVKGRFDKNVKVQGYNRAKEKSNQIYICSLEEQILNHTRTIK